MQGYRPSSVAARLIAIGAFVMALVAFVHVLLLGETLLVRILWAASMAFAIAAHVRRPRLEWPDPGPFLILCVILAASAWLRFYRLGEIPDDYHGDIASQGMEARAFIDGTTSDIFRTMWSDIPAFEFWQLAVTMRVFGDNLHGIAVNTAVHGMLSILGVYLMTRELLNRRIALLASALLAISYTHIHFSRLFTTATPLSFMAFTFFFLARGMRRGGMLPFVLAGICLGLGSQVYYPARMMPVILAVLLPSIYLWDRPLWQQRMKSGMTTMALGFFAAFGPFLAFALTNPTAIIGRGGAVLVSNPDVLAHLKGVYQVDSLRAVLWENTKRSFSMFSTYGDTSTHFGFPYPIVDPMTAVFLVAGVVIALTRLREAWAIVMLVWLFGTIVLGSVISNDPPFWPHLVVLLIPVAVFAAVAIDRVIAVAARFGRSGTIVGSLAVAAAIALMGVRNWQIYYAYVDDNAQPAARIGRIVESTDPTYEIVVVPNPRSAREREVAFVAAGRVAEDEPAEIALDDQRPRRSRALYIVTSNHQAVLDALRRRYPAAVFTPHWAENGDLFVTTVRID